MMKQYLWNLLSCFLFYVIEIYGRIVTSRWCTKKETITYYVLFNNNMVPVRSLRELKEYNDCLYYVKFLTSELNVCLVFDRLEVLVDHELELAQKIKERMPRFRNQLEVIHLRTGNDILSTFQLYTDNNDTFFYDLTQYALKPVDLYDFDKKEFPIEKTDSIQVVKMDLESTEYAADSPFRKAE